MARFSESTGGMAKPLAGCLFILGAAFVSIAGLSLVLGYWLESVDSREIAIQFHGNTPYQVVGPGMYTDLTPFADIKRMKISNMPFCAIDGEVVANDSQAIGVHITGDVRRPGMADSAFILENWSRLSAYWTDDDAVLGKKDCQTGIMSDIGRQAIKVCVGSRPAMQSIIGEARDALRQCVDESLDGLAKSRGLTVENIVVPNAELSPAVRTAMDNITNARFAVQLADQEALKAKADAERELAVQTGRIRVAEGQAQEQARQRATLAQITSEQLRAEQAVIQQQADNNLLAAQTSREVERVKAEAAVETARREVAIEAARATLFQANPAYANSQNIEKAAAAFHAGDKIICEGGCDPTVILGDAQATVPVR